MVEIGSYWKADNGLHIRLVRTSGSDSEYIGVGHDAREYDMTIQNIGHIWVESSEEEYKRAIIKRKLKNG